MSKQIAAARMDWARVFELLYGHSPEDSAPPTYQKVMKVMARDVTSMLLGKSNMVTRQITLEADRQGMAPFLQYVFFILMDRSKEWPRLPEKHKSALQLVRSILSESGNVPPYQDGLTPPPVQEEKRVDMTLTAIAVWASSSLASVLRKDYETISKRHVGSFEKEILLPSDMEAHYYVSSLFETAIEETPLVFPGGHLLNYLFRTIY